MEHDGSDLLARITTPQSGFSPFRALTSGCWLPALIARFAIWRARRKRGPLKFGKTIIAARHVDVAEMLRRDIDFLIAPVNADRIEAVNGGPFILGMDRSPALARERGALYRALSRLDHAALEAKIREEVSARLAGCGECFDAIADFARPVAITTASNVFGIAPSDRQLFAEAVRAIFAHTFLNLGDDEAIKARALAAAPLMREWFEREIDRRRKASDPGEDLMGQLLRDPELDNDTDTVRRCLGGMLVGSIDTTTGTVARVFGVVASDPQLRAAMLVRIERGENNYGLCLEGLRRWPHNPILLRKAARDTALAGVRVASGSTVVAFTQAAMLDPDAFPEPRRALPARPFESYLHFGGGLHPCAGRVVNAVQIPLLVDALLTRAVVPDGAMRWAGPFPDRLPVRSGQEQTV
jgi:cytochrome P450